MNPNIQEKLEQLLNRQEEIEQLLSTQDVIGDQNRFRDLSIELSELNPVAQTYQTYRELQNELDAANEMLNDSDAEIRALAQEELPGLKESIDQIQVDLQKLLLPKDPNDDRNIFLEIRAGTGGDEAAIFSGDLFRMYSNYTQSQKWQVEILSESLGEHGGYKEIITRVIGRGAYSKLKFESGAHRVQRVPETETQGRIHTSACTVAILPEPDEVEEVDINTNDLRIDTFRASGAGGQHVNKTDSAIRITHIPTGIVVECQDERSQHKIKLERCLYYKPDYWIRSNKHKQSEFAETRRNLVGSGDRSERIRTYNYPQGRVTDHRINLTLYKLEEIMTGNLGQIIEPLIAEYQADQLAALSGE